MVGVLKRGAGAWCGANQDVVFVGQLAREGVMDGSGGVVKS